MALVLANSGKLLLLNWAIQVTSTPENLTLKLFTNNHTPVDSDLPSAYTEATFTGYAAKTLTRSSWGSATQSGTAASSAYSSGQSWTNTGSTQTIYGYFVVGATSGTLMWMEAFASPPAVTNGTTLTVFPALTLDSANSP